MKSAIIILALGVIAVQAGDSMEYMLKNKIDTFNVLSNCWGKNNMLKYVVAYKKALEYCGQIDAPFNPSNGLRPFQGFQSSSTSTEQLEALRLIVSNPSLASLFVKGQQNGLFRGKRQAEGLLNPTEEDKQEFVEDFENFKMEMKSKIGNLTCVMTQLKMLDASGNINIRFYTDGVWNELEKTEAARDPAFVQKVKDGFSDCYKISMSWPQQSLERNPIFKKYGRHMIFFECAKKVEHKMCYQYEIKQWIEAMYGPVQTNKPEGFPEDNYDAATLAMKVLYSSATPEEMFVDEAIWGKSKF